MVEYHSENGFVPWVCVVGKRKSVWFAYPTFLKAIINYPRLVWRFRNHG